MSTTARRLMEFLAYVAFFGVVGALSSNPAIRLLEPEQAVLRMAFSHAGEPVSDCRRLSQEELNKLPPNMRQPTECPRERLPIFVRLDLDGRKLFEAEMPPTGLWNDGKTTVNKRFEVAAGSHRIRVGMRDSAPSGDFDYIMERKVTIEPGDNLVIGFDGDSGEFRLTGRRP